MISLNKYYKVCQQATGKEPNLDQKKALRAPPEEALFIVAGPGTGKTACLTLRILKLIFVDDISPNGILATTFTKKAAAELRSRVLGWGFRLIEQLITDTSLSRPKKQQIESTDINQIVTGTIDSICEALLRDFREPGTQPPILVDEFVSRTLMLRDGLLSTGLFRDDDLNDFLFDISARVSRWGWNIGAKTDLLMTLWDRRIQDQIDWAKFLRQGPRSRLASRKKVDRAFAGYAGSLSQRLMVDFAMLEQEVLNRLRNKKLQDFQDQLQVVLVDEYQDTNLLQESIYFELAKSCNGALTVVGDDDQSLYRFRGATVELFSDFTKRFAEVLRKKPKNVFLKTNYRSTKAIISLTRGYASLDSKYQDVRVKDKPPLKSGPNAKKGVPVMGMFRDSVETLATDLSQLVQRVFRGSGYRLPNGIVINRFKNGGDIGDSCLLCSSPAETSGSRVRLPLLIRQELLSREIDTFNPRGQRLTTILIINVLGGLLLECLDPGGRIQDDTSGLNDDIIIVFQRWRNEAIKYAGGSLSKKGLLQFAKGWASRNPGRKGWRWPASVPVLYLVYGLVHFFPELYDDPEGQIYLEVFTRQVSVCEQVGSFAGRVVTDSSNIGLSDASIKDLLRNFLGPIASGAVKVNEELMEYFPRDRFCILSIHQAKGLEFPLTIVDVGSDFKTNHHSHAFKRFPKSGGASHAMEDLVRKGHPGFKTLKRSAQDRAFDDLYRQFFVAFSRAQDVLMLVGLNSTLPRGDVPNIATGWKRDGDCSWENALPFTEI